MSLLRIADPAWRSWLSATPSPSATAFDEYHRAMMAWLKASPAAALLSSVEADFVITTLNVELTRLNRLTRQRIDVGMAVVGVGGIAMIGAVVGGPVGIAASILCFGGLLYTVNEGSGHNRRQDMIEEIEMLMDQLIERLGA
jgi:hypothetical protein